MKYKELIIGKQDIIWLENLANRFNLDLLDSDIEDIYWWYLANQIASDLYSRAIDNLKISKDSKNKLKENININLWIYMFIASFPLEEQLEIQKIL